MALTQILGRRDTIEDNVGNPLSGGLVNIYEPNTLTRVTSYSDSALSVENANPVVLSGAGRANIWISRNVDIRITDKDGNLVVEELSANPDDLAGDGSSGLVPNGSFETDTDANDVPDGWTSDVNDPGSNNGIDATESTDGGQSWRTQSAGNGGGELVTTDFFPVNDTDDLRVSFDLRSTVATVRNIVRIEWYDVSQVSISNSDIYDSTANPAIFTSQNLQQTPPAGARFAKLRIIGGAAGGILAGITYWDNFNVFYPLVVVGQFDNISISGNDIISTNTNGDINITPNGVGRTVVSALTSTGAALTNSVLTNPALPGDINTATPPTTEAITALLDFTDLAGDDNIGRVGFDGSNNIRIRNLMHGGGLIVTIENSAGTEQTAIDATADGGVGLYDQNVRKLLTEVDGINVQGNGSAGAGGVHNTEINLQEANGTNRGFIGYEASATFDIRSINSGNNLRLQAQDAGLITRTLFEGDPDGAFTLYHDGNISMQSGPSGILVRDPDGAVPQISFRTNGDVEVAVIQQNGADLDIENLDNGGRIRLQGNDAGGVFRNIIVGDPDGASSMFHAGTEEIQTQDSNASDQITGGAVRHFDQVFYPIGIAPLVRQVAAGPASISDTHVLKCIDITGGAAGNNYSLLADTTILNGAWGMITNTSGSSKDIVQGGGVTITWQDGAGGQNGDRMLADGGVLTWWKISDSLYYVWGVGIS